MKIIIIGMCSHSQVVEQICRDIGYTEIYFASYSYEPKNKPDNYLGDIEKIENVENYSCIIGIGDNFLRKEIVKKLKLNWIKAIHPTSYIANKDNIGEGTLICPGVAVQTGSIIGKHCIINTNASVDHHNIVENFSHIAPNSTLCGNVNIGYGCFIGAGSTIVPNIKLRPWSFVKANSLVKDSTSPIKIYEPYIKKYKDSVIKAINDGWISSQGEFIIKASEKLQELLGFKHAILMANGTCATHCLFLALKYKYPTINKIYVPNNVYVASWNSVLMEYSIDTIEVMDTNIDTFNINTDEEYIKTLETNSAVLIVHNVGNIVNVPRLKRLRPDIIFLEDACEGLFGKYENNFAGTQSLCSSISFFANKIITSGEGGAVFTNDTEVFEYLKRKINQGMTSERYVHDIHAYNYRMTNIQAALLYDQLNDLTNILQLKTTVFKNYNELLKNNEKLLVFKEEENTKSAPWIFPIRVLNNHSYEKIDEFMKKKGIEIRPFFYPITKHKHLKNIFLSEKEKELSYKLSKEIIMIPSYPELSYREQEYIIETLIDYTNIL